jgi:hypothetical protein
MPKRVSINISMSPEEKAMIQKKAKRFGKISPKTVEMWRELPEEKRGKTQK